MRFSRLGLDRYGAFAGRELAFDPAARLVVIEGANEAGKTTALHAASDALFGIEERSRFKVGDDYKDMRLSATVVAPGGASLSFARLKRRRATLVAPDTDAPLPDDALAPFVGGHDRAAFLEIFGLDQERLRAGGRDLLAGHGELAEVLITAAPGLKRIAAMRDAYLAEAGRVFNPGRRVGSNLFYQASDRVKDARARMREGALRADEMRRLRGEAEASAEARRLAVEAEGEAAREAAWADLLARAAGVLRQIAAEEEALAALGPLPDVPAPFAGQAHAALATLEEARAAFERAAAEEVRAAAACAAVAVDEAVLSRAEEVEACDEQRSAIQKARDDLPKRRTEAAEARAGLARIAVHLGLADVETLCASLPAPPLVARAGDLAVRLTRLEARAEALATERDAHARETALAEAVQAGLGPVEDPEPLRRRLAALDGAEERARALETLAARLGAGRTELRERLRRLGPLGLDLDGLCLAPLPQVSAAEAMLRAVAEAEEAVARQHQAAMELTEQAERARARHAALDGGGTAPTQEAVAAARATRDALWNRLRPLALAERAPMADDREAARGLDGAIVVADRIADERQRETHRLAELVQVARELADIELRITFARTGLAQAETRRAGALRNWEGLFAASGLARPADAAAIAFLREAEAMREARSLLLRQEAEGQAAQAAVDFDRAATEELRRDLGLPPLGAGPLRMADLREAVERKERRHRDARDQQRDLARLALAREDLAVRAAGLEELRAALAAEAAEVLPRVAVRPGAPAEEVRAALGLWREAETLSGTLATAEHRAATIARDEAAFAGRVAALAQAAGEDAAGDPLVLARRLRQRLNAAREASANAKLAGKEHGARKAAAGAAAEALARAGAVVDVLRARAGDVPAEDFPTVLERLAQAAALAVRVAEARQRLADMCRGRDLEAVRAQTSGRDDAELAGRAAEAAAAHTPARELRDKAVERDAQARAALEAFIAREGAADAAQEEQNALADLAVAVEVFSRSHVAGRLLARAIERYREAHQSPIVTRASGAFSGLTLGRWSGIAVDYDADSPRLAAVRGERPQALDGLSEGTADQLFLALRVAAIEEHARRATPLPFIADDLFVTFDEARTEAGLRLLAELGALTQVIVFTHHAHVAEAARRAVGTQCQVIRL
ncbi:AAA family ATPase [Xanthobacter autotrophicus DSM 431]|uniref:AAA family ATPase n=1 Tax=Xanthobacter nonsaccharivorans TaxID=3119912 RepID=UPI00372C964D